MVFAFSLSSSYEAAPPSTFKVFSPLESDETVPTIKTRIDKKTGKKRDIVYNRQFTFEMGRKRLRELYRGGLCCICGGWPDYKVLYDLEGAKRVERYCQKHYDQWQKGINK